MSKTIEELLPVLATGVDSKNSQKVIPCEAKNLKTIRATSMNVLRECPEQFYAKFCLGLPQPTGTGPNYALIGTMFHEVIESFILDGWNVNSKFASYIQVLLKERGIRESEIISLGKYMQRISAYRNHTIAVEHEFDYELVPGLPRIKGHIDWVCKIGRNTVLIIDHKTNRQPKQLELWIDDFQTMLYAWAVRKWLGQYLEVHFKIGYVNLHYDADWITSPSFDNTLKVWYQKAWEDLLQQERYGKLKRTGCKTCKYCPRSGKCEVEKTGKEDNTNLLNITLGKFNLK